jgi:hypothetical protein
MTAVTSQDRAGRHRADEPGSGGRDRTLVWQGLAGTAAVVVVAGAGFWHGWPAAFAALLACGLVALALSLPGITWDGLLVGFATTGYAAMTWTYTNQPKYAWGVLALGSLALGVAARPWRVRSRLREVAGLYRLGPAWLGLGYWAIGAVGGALVFKPNIVAGRLVYLAIALVTLLVVVQCGLRGKDPTIGLVAAWLISAAVILLAGAGNAFSTLHYAPASAWGSRFEERFWGGSPLVYHPNSIATLAVVAFLRISPDRRFAPWQRVAAAASATLLLVLTDSRTGALVTLTAICVWAALALWQRLDGRAVFTRLVASGGVAVVLLAASGVLFEGFFLQARYSPAKIERQAAQEASAPGRAPAVDVSNDVTSGRAANWNMVFKDFRHDTAVGKAFGNTASVRGVLLRYAHWKDQPKLLPDNSAISALRRAGVVGLAAYALGVALVLRNALLRKDTPRWHQVTAVAALASIPFADWMIQGPLWLTLLGAEIVAVTRPIRDRVPRLLRALR